jgi:nitrogen-specific signal transduction histidine kinase/ActR/RegA family two-component response regulator
MQKAAQTRVRRLEKMSAIGQLASGIAHDFNNILGATGAFAGLIADAVSAGSNEHLYAMRILAACQRATDLVRQLATFTRTKDAPREPLHVRDIVQEVAALLSRRLPQAVNLSVTDTTENAVVIANSSQLVQVVLNLAVNACDAMAASGGELCISATAVAAPEKEPLPHHLLLDSEREGFVYATGHLMSSQRYIRISVTDTGTGIARDIAERIFEPFFTTKDKRAGSGLGLSIVTNIVTDHEGIVCVRSRAGLGSTFHIYLPVHDIPVEPRTIHREDAGVGRRETLRGDERVLIVDDEIDIADALSLSLARWGYRTQAFYNPQDALDLFALDPNAWDVVILDQTMPRMHGTQLLQAMKSLRHDIKIVLCSGLAASGKSGGKGKEDAFFVKPVAADTIATAIRRLMTARAS